MKSGSIKNLMILILVLVNIFMLILVVPQQLQTKREQEELNQTLSHLFARQGISFDPDIIPKEVSLYPLDYENGGNPELSAVENLLGTVILMEDESSPYQNTYLGPNQSSAIFRIDSSFEIVLSGGTAITGSYYDSAQKLLSSIGFSPWSELEEETVSGNAHQLTAYQSIMGVKVYSEGICMTYENGVLTRMEGTWYIGSPVRSGDTASVSAKTALVSFLNSQESLGWLCSSIQAVAQGYRESDTPSVGVTKLIPVWRIDTDTGSFEVNGITGDVRSLS